LTLAIKSAQWTRAHSHRESFRQSRPGLGL